MESRQQKKRNKTNNNRALQKCDACTRLFTRVYTRVCDVITKWRPLVDSEFCVFEHMRHVPCVCDIAEVKNVVGLLVVSVVVAIVELVLFWLFDNDDMLFGHSIPFVSLQ